MVRIYQYCLSSELHDCVCLTLTSSTYQMAAQYVQPQHIFLETVDIMIICLKDRAIKLIEGYETDGGFIASGTPLQVRADLLRHNPPVPEEEETVIVMGCGCKCLLLLHTHHKRSARF